MDVAINVLGEVKKRREVTVDIIKKIISKKYNITVEQLESTSRKKDIVTARHLSIYMTRELLK
jgi:chromosomal replication initiator protein